MRHRRFRASTGALILASAGVASVVAASPASAYCTAGIGSWGTISGGKTMYIPSSYPQSWKDILKVSNGRWSDQNISGSALHYNAPIDTTSPTSYAYNSRRIDLAANGFGNVPGYAIGSDSTPTRNNVGVLFNTTWGYNSSGVMDQMGQNVDLETIATHEIGHASGLAHPSSCGTPSIDEKAGVMYVNYTTKRIPQYDDKVGIAALY